MKRQFVFGTIFSAALSVGLGAQTGSTAPTQRGQQGSTENTALVTVSGCLQSADAAGPSGNTGSATGTAGSATAGSSSGTSAQSGSSTRGNTAAPFVLLNAHLGSGAASTTATGTGTGGTGTTGSGTSGSATGGTATGATSGTVAQSTTSGDRYLLVGGNQQTLRSYVNSQVEISGRVLPQGRMAGTGSGTGSGSAAGTATATGTGTGTSQSGATGNDAAQRLQVTSVRQVNTTCSGSNR